MPSPGGQDAWSERPRYWPPRNAGDASAIDIVNSAADQLGSLIGLVVNMLDPEAIVLGGGLGLAAGPYRDG
jgi:predicted NBD/HSP70 family sugar kinase